MFSDPGKNLRAFGISDGMTVADFGAGTGFYSIAAGKMAQGGRVYAIEIQKDFLDTIRAKVKEARLSNVEAIWGNVEKAGGTKLADKSVDRIICSNILFQVEDKRGFMDEIKRIMKPGGRLLLIEHDPESSHLKIRSAVSKEKTKEMFEERGFKVESEIDAGSHHYGMIMSRKE